MKPAYYLVVLLFSGFAHAQSEQVANESVDYARLRLEAGVRLLDTQEPGRAREFLLEAHELLSQELGQSHQDTALAALYLGTYWITQGRALRALPLLESSKAVFEQSNNSSKLVEAHVLIARALEEVDKSAQATPHLQSIGRLIASGYGTQFEERPIYSASPRYINLKHCTQAVVGSGPCFSYHGESRVVVTFDVDEQGFVSNVRVTDRQGDQRFAHATKEAIQKFRYAPRFVDGRAVAREDVSFTFETAEKNT